MSKVVFPKAPATPPATSDEQSTDALILESFAKLDKVALGISFGSTLGLFIFVATLFLLFKGGSPLGPNLGLLTQYFIGYSVSWEGSFIGLGYGFLSGFILGWSIALLRNVLVSSYLHNVKLKTHLRTLQDFLDQP
jgi:hypothetical protein